MNIWVNFTSPETRMIVLPDAETAPSSFLWTKQMKDGKIDGQTDRQNPSSYYSALYCEQCGRAVTKNSS